MAGAIKNSFTPFWIYRPFRVYAVDDPLHILIYDIIILDSITHLLTHAESNDIMDFFGTCRYAVDKIGQTFVINMHPYALNQELLVRVRSFCDGHIILEIKTFRDKTALTMNVAKLKGASKTVNELISFEVSPAYGIKILPFSSARG